MILIVICVYSYVLLSINQSFEDDRQNKLMSDEYLPKFCDVLEYAQLYVEKCVEDHNEKERIQDIIDEFDELIIADCIRLYKK